MKRKIFSGIAILTIVAAMAINVNFGSKYNDLSDISLANVEALTDPESIPGQACQYYCKTSSGDKCVIRTPYVTLTCFDRIRILSA